MKNRSFMSILMAFLILGCSDKVERKQKNQNNLTYLPDKVECITKEDKETIIQNILKTKDIQGYLIPLSKKKLDVQILQNEFITSNLGIHINGKKVILIDSTKISERTFRLKFPRIDCDAKMLNFAVWYEFEHADITGKAIGKEGKWVIEVLGHGIVD